VRIAFTPRLDAGWESAQTRRVSTESNRGLIIALIEEGWNARRLAVFDELYDPGVIDHGNPAGLETRDCTKQLAVLCWRAFADLRVIIHDQVAEGDRVVTRWMASGTHTGELMGVPPTGNPIVLDGVRIDRLLGEKVVECWAVVDWLGTLRQIGAVTLDFDVARHPGHGPGPTEPNHHMDH
jgi:predicted ester cyclase